jgi:hypothetical protein
MSQQLQKMGLGYFILKIKKYFNILICSEKKMDSSA